MAVERELACASSLISLAAIYRFTVSFLLYEQVSCACIVCTRLSCSVDPISALYPVSGVNYYCMKCDDDSGYKN